MISKKPIGRADHAQRVLAVREAATGLGYRLLEAAPPGTDKRIVEWLKKLARGDADEQQPRPNSKA